jgi:hypothetical protein
VNYDIKKRLARSKHSSLIPPFINYSSKKRLPGTNTSLIPTFVNYDIKKRVARSKHSSLIPTFVNYGSKKGLARDKHTS